MLSEGESSYSSQLQEIQERQRESATAFELNHSSHISPEEANEELVSLLRKKEGDVDRLLTILKQLHDSSVGHSLEAVRLLRDDVERREKRVTERENRVWGWRIVASARDAELEEEVKRIEARERAIHTREQRLLEGETRLLKREEAVEQRSLLLNEEYVLQTRELREELKRIKNRSNLDAVE